MNVLAYVEVHEDGGGDWLTRSLDEWAGLLSVSYCTVRRIVETLQRKRLITTKRSRRKSYRVDYARLEKFLAKATTQPSAAIGQQFKYRITVPAVPVGIALHDVRILDDLGLSAANMRFVSASVVSGGTWTLTNTSGSSTNLVLEDTATGIDIPANGQAVIDVTVELLNTSTNDAQQYQRDIL